MYFGLKMLIDKKVIILNVYFFITMTGKLLFHNSKYQEKLLFLFLILYFDVF